MSVRLAKPHARYKHLTAVREETVAARTKHDESASLLEWLSGRFFGCVGDRGAYLIFDMQSLKSNRSGGEEGSWLLLLGQNEVCC